MDIIRYVLKTGSAEDRIQIVSAIKTKFTHTTNKLTIKVWSKTLPQIKLLQYIVYVVNYLTVKPNNYEKRRRFRTII